VVVLRDLEGLSYEEIAAALELELGTVEVEATPGADGPQGEARTVPAMTCHEARELFSALIDDALGGEERAVLDAHLATCADCGRELQRFRDTVALLRAVEPARAPAGFVDRVLQTARPASWPQRLLRALFLPWPVKLPVEAAAVVLVTVGVCLLVSGHTRGPKGGPPRVAGADGGRGAARCHAATFRDVDREERRRRRRPGPARRISSGQPL